MFSHDVQLAFSLAVREAQRRHHEFLTSEHLLYALLFEDLGQQIIRNCGGDLVYLGLGGVISGSGTTEMGVQVDRL